MSAYFMQISMGCKNPSQTMNLVKLFISCFISSVFMFSEHLKTQALTTPGYKFELPKYPYLLFFCKEHHMLSISPFFVHHLVLCIITFAL